MWAHDQVRQAAPALLPQHMRESFRLLISTRILVNTPESELGTTIFDILGHMNKAIRLTQPPQQKYKIAKLNLMAGNKCIQTSSFHSAAGYFINGIALLSASCLEHHYKLSTELHNAAEGALFVTEDLAMLKLLSLKMQTNASCFDDNIFSFNNLVGYLVSTGQPENAITLCSTMLDELDEPLPAPTMDITWGICVKEFVKVKFWLGQNILHLPRMVD